MRRALSNDFLNSSNENGRLYSSKFFDLKFNLVFAFCFLKFEILNKSDNRAKYIQQLIQDCHGLLEILM